MSSGSGLRPPALRPTEGRATNRPTSGWQPSIPLARPRRLKLVNWLIKLVDMNVTEIGAFEAKTRLSELLDRVARGQVYRITKRGKPVAELRPVAVGTRRPRFGSDKGRVAMGGDFDAPVPDMAKYLK